jgi:hypothetical protein
LVERSERQRIQLDLSKLELRLKHTPRSKASCGGCARNSRHSAKPACTPSRARPC